MQKRNTISGSTSGNNLKVLRKRASLTQVGLAEASGFTQSDISYWECNGLESVTCKRALRLARALGCDVEDLFEGVAL